MNMSGYLHIIQYFIYTCLPYGNGLSQYELTILLVITIPKGIYFCSYIKSNIYYSGCQLNPEIQFLRGKIN